MFCFSQGLVPQTNAQPRNLCHANFAPPTRKDVLDIFAGPWSRGQGHTPDAAGRPQQHPGWGIFSVDFGALSNHCCHAQSRGCLRVLLNSWRGSMGETAPGVMENMIILTWRGAFFLQTASRKQSDVTRGGGKSTKRETNTTTCILDQEDARTCSSLGPLGKLWQIQRNPCPAPLYFYQNFNRTIW